MTDIAKQYPISFADWSTFFRRIRELRSCGQGTVLTVLDQLGIAVQGVQCLKLTSRTFELVFSDPVAIVVSAKPVFLREQMSVTRQRLFLMLEHIVKYGDALPQDLEFVLIADAQRDDDAT